VADPVGTGLVASLARPGGNVTGSSSPSPQLTAKQIELLKEVVPRLSRLAVLWNPTSPAHPMALREIEAAAAALRVKVQRVGARSADELESAFSTITRQRPDGLLALGTPIFDAQQKKIADFATRTRLPAIFNKPLFAEVGGLMAYGARYADFFRHAAMYVDKILKGVTPGELPVEQPATFELIINLKTAKTLGVTIPPSLLLRADRVIQ
ncbi:MAG: ABC transporter substrate-binding protein, partial [Candidatus Rokubacteria bacterium]|nr:ABC transporter substrate-binding protein [Candidatus Rokubacteria bacterium]